MENDVKEGPKYRKLTTTEIVKIHTRLNEVIVHNSDETVSYSGDSSDSKIAEEFGVSVNSVSKLRLDMFGKLRLTNNESPLPGYEALRQRIKRMEQWISKFDPEWKIEE